MSEAIRYQYYNLPATGGMVEIDPRILEYHPCREIWNLSEELARSLWQNHLSGHTPIRIRELSVVDGTRRIQAAIFLGLTAICVMRHS